MNKINEDLLNILICPKCKGTVTEEAEGIRCTNETCSLVYPVRDGIPIMVIKEAAACPR